METVRNSSFSSMETTGISELTFRHSMKTEVTEESNNNNCEIEVLDDNGNQNKEEDLNLGDTTGYTLVQLNNLFQRGQEYETNFKPAAALQCYLGCIKAFKHRNTFDHLPQCIHKVAEIYHRQQQNGHSVQLAQTERLFSEAGIRDIDDIQQMIDELVEDVESGATDLKELTIIELLQSDDFENLAKEFQLKQQYELALKYARWSFKLKHQIYGSNSQRVKLSMNLFAAICLELRSQHDPDSYKHTPELDNHRVSAGNTPRSPESIMPKPSRRTPVSILRQRSEDRTKETEREKKQVRFHKSVEEKLRQKEKTDEMAGVARIFVILTLSVVLMVSMGIGVFYLIEASHSTQALLQKHFQR